MSGGSLSRFVLAASAIVLSIASHPLAAQDAREPQVPLSFTPPAGLCRVWLSGVPASQQPAPTDCASAIKNRPGNAAVVFGPKRRNEPSEMESFTRRGGVPAARFVAPTALAPRRRDDARDRTDTVAKAARKPEKPQ